jgi:hypothetical protein
LEPYQPLWTLPSPDKEPIMPRHATRTWPALRQSRGQRDQRAAPSPAALAASASQGHEQGCTFNWEAEQDSPLRPHYLGTDERLDLSSASLRLLVNLTAAGQPTPLDLHSTLLQEAPKFLAEAISQGIHRWHSGRSSATRLVTNEPG